MNFRTDLALERAEDLNENVRGIKKYERKGENTKTTVIEVTSENAAKAIGKPCGKYITVETKPFSEESDVFDGRLSELVLCLRDLLPEKNGLVLVAGVGNPDITSDALGPFFSSKIFSTRHISDELKKAVGFSKDLRAVAAVSTGVLGQTGLESSEYIKYIADGIKPDCIITVDALAARSLSRLGCTVQLSNTGIAPGSGVGNSRKRIDEEYIGVPVIAIGVPTVVGASVLAGELLGDENGGRLKSVLSKRGADMTVTPKDIDLLIKNAAYLLALSVNCALQPTLSPEEIAGLM